MNRLHITLILLAGSILMLGLAGAADNNFGTMNLPQDRDWHDGYICQPSYTGDCANRPPGTYCMSYSDGYIWAIPDIPVNGLWHYGGYWHGNKVEIIHGTKADYCHVLGTSLVSTVDLSSKECHWRSGFSDLALPLEGTESSDADDAQVPGPSGSPVTLAIHVHEGDFNGLMLPGAKITGQDAAGNSFEKMTDSNGTALIDGQPGAWKFSFAKEGYDPLDLDYDVNEAGEGAVYLVAADTQNSTQQ